MPQSSQAENSFLNEFTKELIKNYHELYFEKAEEEKLQEKDILPMQLTIPILPQRMSLQLPPQLQPPQIQVPVMPRQMPLQAKPPASITPVYVTPIFPAQMQPYKTHIQAISFNIPTGKTGFDKLLPFLNDRSIIKIEYRAESQPLFVTRLGQTFATKITLTEQEATGILQEFSKQSRIPIMKGVFRVYTKNFMLFAVISDFIKPRFIIQKIGAGGLLTLSKDIIHIL